ncbi:MAG: 50S ribosomal protein L24 [Pseudomonadota bacterium]
MSQPKYKIKTGDTVVVLAGKDKGKTGEIKKMLMQDGKAIVGGINMVQRHRKPSMQQAGGIDNKEAPVHISNLALADPKTGKPTKVGYRIEDGKKVRFAKASGDVING